MTTNNFNDAYERFISLREELGEAECLGIELNEYQRKFVDDDSPEKFAFGGNRSGKSFTWAYVLFLLACGLYTPRGNKRKKRYQVWISSLDANLTKQVVIPLMRKLIPAGWMRINENRNWAKINSSFGVSVRVDFKSADSGREKYQGASVDLIILDEEHSEDIYKECLMRILDSRGQILTAMTPLLGMTWVYDYSRKRFNITLPTMANKTLRQADIEMLSEGFTDKEKQMRLEGKFVNLAGSSFLDPDDRHFVEHCVCDPIKRYSWVSGEWVENDVGEFCVYKDTRKEKDRPFIVTCDPASGSGRDYTPVDVYLHSDKLELVAQYRSNITKINEIAKIIHALAVSYNGAVINIDRTDGRGESILQTLTEMRYYKIAGRENYERFGTDAKVGFKFTTFSREMALIELRKAIQNQKLITHSKQTAQELSVYRYDINKQRYDHPASGNDDTIMTAALAVMTSRIVPQLVADVEKKFKIFSITGEYAVTFDELMEREDRLEEIDEEHAEFI